MKAKRRSISTATSVEEAKMLHEAKRRSGLTWLQVMYRGLGLRRETLKYKPVRSLKSLLNKKGMI